MMLSATFNGRLTRRHEHKHRADNTPNADYLHKYKKDKEVLLNFFLERLESTWEEATKPSPVNRMSGKSSGNEPWKHVDAIALGKRHIGDRKNRMSTIEHIRKHTARQKKSAAPQYDHG